MGEMRRAPPGLRVLLALAAVGCGGGESEPPVAPATPAAIRMLTILEPQHGAVVPATARVRIADTGTAPLEPVDVGIFVDGELRAQSSERLLTVRLAPGVHALLVQAIDGEGTPTTWIDGDEILVRVDASGLRVPEPRRNVPVQPPLPSP